MAGTVVLTSHSDPGTVRRAVITCTADAADGSFPATTLAALGLAFNGTIVSVQTNPGATAPTDDWDLTLVDGDGIDRFAGICLNRDTTTSELERPHAIVEKGETLTLTIAGNSVNSAVIVITLLYASVALVVPGELAVTVDSELPAAAALTDNFANPTTTNVAAMEMVWDGATWDRAPGTSADGTLVNLGANNDVTIISGQAAITGGAGVVAAGTPRVTLASDDPAVTALQILDNIVAGSEAQVDIVAALPAGANNIGDVDVLTIAAGDNNIGNVDIVTVPAPLSTAGGGTEATALRVTLASDSTGLVSVDDNAGSLTIDNAALSVVGGGLEATALRVTLASDSTGLVSVDDNSGSLTIDNADITAAAASLSVMDDWDETNRAAVNTIAGQVGVQGGAGVVTALSQRVAIATDANVVDTELPAAAALADGAAATPTTPTVGAVPLLYNGSTVDRERGNLEASLLVSAARTATTNSPDQTNHNGKGVTLVIDVTVEGPATLSLKVQGKDSISANYYDIADFGTVYTASAEAPTVTRACTLYPGALAADHAGIAKSGVLPRTWRAVVTHADATTCTYSLSAVTHL